MMESKRGHHELKRTVQRILIFMLSSIMVFSFTGCGKLGNKGSSDNSDPMSGISGSSVPESGETEEYRELIDQLDDLAEVLNGLDQISESDTEIPTP